MTNPLGIYFFSISFVSQGPQYFFQGARLDQDKGAARVSELLTSSTRIDLAKGMDNEKIRTLLQVINIEILIQH